VLDLFDTFDSQLKKLYPESKRKPQSKQAATKAPVPSFVRYNSWIDAHKFVVATEEADVLSIARTRTRLLAHAGLLTAQGTSAGVLIDDDTIDSDSIEISGDEEESLGADESVSEEDEESIIDDAIETQSGNGSEDETVDDEDTIDDEEEIDQVAAEEAYMRQLQDEAFESELRK